MRIVIALALAATAAGPAAAQSGDLAASWSRALSYREFLADTTRRAEWRKSGERADTWAAEYAAKAAVVPGQWRLLVIAENSCGDGINSVPYLARMAELSPNVELRILRKADAPSLMATRKLEGRSAVPIVIVLDDRFEERGHWIERPSTLRALVAAAEGRVSDGGLARGARAWYRGDGGRAVMDDVLAIMEGRSRGVVNGTPTCGGRLH